jgi:uncharacterized protein YjbI with pentapeptide repeats
MTTDNAYRNIDFSKTNPHSEYEECSFIGCTFANVDLSNINFIECTFESCDFTLAKFHNTGLKDVRFTNCKLMGLFFNDCNPFLLKMHFKSCQLDYASFSGLKLEKIDFEECQMREVDFTETDLGNAKFNQCDLEGATFEYTNLKGADFRTAFKYAFNPEVNQIKGAKFSRMGLEGLLQKFDIDIS